MPWVLAIQILTKLRDFANLLKDSEKKKPNVGQIIHSYLAKIILAKIMDPIDPFQTCWATWVASFWRT